MNDIFKKYLVPYLIDGLEFIRIGPKNDGGYVVPKELVPKFTKMICVGIGDNIGFEIELLKLNKKKALVFCFDNTIESLPIIEEKYIPNIQFIPKGLGFVNPRLLEFSKKKGFSKYNDRLITIQEAYQHCAISDNDITLFKMDAEGAEWNCGMNTFDFSNIDCIIMELHSLSRKQSYPNYSSVLSNIYESHICTHVHANNVCRLFELQGKNYPGVMEVTFINKKHVKNRQVVPSPFSAPRYFDQRNIIDRDELSFDYWNSYDNNNSDNTAIQNRRITNSLDEAAFRETAHRLYVSLLKKEPEINEIDQLIQKYDSMTAFVNKLISMKSFTQNFLKKNNPNKWLNNAKGILTTGNYASFVIPTYDRFQLSDHIRNGDSQRKEFNTLTEYLRQEKLLNSESIFIDIGANIGTHTIYALQQSEFTKAYAIEPLPSNLFFLNTNLKLNSLHSRVEIIETAVADESGFVNLYQNPINCGDNRLEARKINNDNLFKEIEFKSIKVQVCTLDDIFKKFSINLNVIGLIWMDVQGAEGLILQPSKLLKSCHCPIYIEFWPYGMKKLDSFKLLREFILNNVKAIIRFVKGDIVQYKPDEIDELYSEFDNNGFSVCDLLLIR